MGRTSRLAALVAAGLAAAFAAPATVAAAPALTVELITWDVIGLDSNKVTEGPNMFPVGARVCNTTGSNATGVRADFVWDSTNPYIALEHQPTIVLGTVAAGACQDLYYNVVVQRDPAAYETARRYHIEISADGTTTISTPRPRELYIERLVSQNRNHVDGITGPGGSPAQTEVKVGGTYSYELQGGTATNGYEQLEVYLNFPNSIFQVLSVDAVYTGPAGGTNDSVYADACGWDPVPTSPTYRSCIGPTAWGGKAGGNVVLVYRVRVVGTGTGTIFGLIHDFSGSSYHYNADYGQDSLTITSRLDNTTTTTTTTPATGTVPRSATTVAVTTVPADTTGTTVPPTVPVPTWRLPDTGAGHSLPTMSLIGTGLVGLGVVLRRRRPPSRRSTS